MPCIGRILSGRLYRLLEKHIAQVRQWVEHSGLPGLVGGGPMRSIGAILRCGRARASTGSGWAPGRFPPLIAVLGALSAWAIAAQAPVQAQKKRAGDTFYLKAGVGLSDYAGDGASGDDVTDRNDFLFDADKFTDGDVFPYVLSGELIYQISPAFGTSLGYRFGQYPFVSGVPFTVDPDLTGEGGNLGTVRHTIQLLGRYTLKAEDWTVAPYLDAGMSVSFGGNAPGVGPSVGAGLDVVLNKKTALFLESRTSVMLSDGAVDGIDNKTPIDTLSNLVSLGVRYTLSRDVSSP